MKRLIISMDNLRDDKASKLVDKVIKLLKRKFLKRLDKAMEKPQGSLKYMVVDNANKKGFKVFITGEEEEIKKEHKYINDAFEKLEKNKFGTMGLNALTTMGLAFNYFIEDFKNGK
jgi:hypothetical protein